ANYNGICAYSPNPLTIQSGDSVVWMNADSTPHTATSDDLGNSTSLTQPAVPANSFSTPSLAAGASSTIGPFINTTGSVQTKLYHCSLHPDTMKGTLIIQPNHPPTAVSMTPQNVTSVVGVPQTFTLTLSDPDGWQNIAVVNLYLSGSGGLHNEWLH